MFTLKLKSRKKGSNIWFPFYMLSLNIYLLTIYENPNFIPHPSLTSHHNNLHTNQRIFVARL